MCTYIIEGKSQSTRWFLTVESACDAAYNEVVNTGSLDWFMIIPVKVGV